MRIDTPTVNPAAQPDPGTVQKPGVESDHGESSFFSVLHEVTEINAGAKAAKGRSACKAVRRERAEDEHAGTMHPSKARQLSAHTAKSSPSDTNGVKLKPASTEKEQEDASGALNSARATDPAEVSSPNPASDVNEPPLSSGAAATVASAGGASSRRFMEDAAGSGNRQGIPGCEGIPQDAPQQAPCEIAGGNELSKKADAASRMSAASSKVDEAVGAGQSDPIQSAGQPVSRDSALSQAQPGQMPGTDHLQTAVDAPGSIAPLTDASGSAPEQSLKAQPVFPFSAPVQGHEDAQAEVVTLEPSQEQPDAAALGLRRAGTMPGIGALEGKVMDAPNAASLRASFMRIPPGSAPEQASASVPGVLDITVNETAGTSAASASVDTPPANMEAMRQDPRSIVAGPAEINTKAGPPVSSSFPAVNLEVHLGGTSNGSRAQAADVPDGSSDSVISESSLLAQLKKDAESQSPVLPEETQGMAGVDTTSRKAPVAESSARIQAAQANGELPAEGIAGTFGNVTGPAASSNAGERENAPAGLEAETLGTSRSDADASADGPVDDNAAGKWNESSAPAGQVNRPAAPGGKIEDNPAALIQGQTPQAARRRATAFHHAEETAAAPQPENEAGIDGQELDGSTIPAIEQGASEDAGGPSRPRRAEGSQREQANQATDSVASSEAADFTLGEMQSALRVLYQGLSTRSNTETPVFAALRSFQHAASISSTTWGVAAQPQLHAAADFKSLLAALTPKAGAPAQGPDFLAQIAGRIQSQLRDNESVIRLHLKPGNLGRLEIKAETSSSGVLATIVAESSHVRDYLESNLQLLQQNFQDQGLKVDRIHVTVQQDHLSQQSSSGSQESSSGANRNSDARFPDRQSGSREEAKDDLVLDQHTLAVLSPHSTFHAIA